MNTVKLRQCMLDQLPVKTMSGEVVYLWLEVPPSPFDFGASSNWWGNTAPDVFGLAQVIQSYVTVDQYQKFMRHFLSSDLRPLTPLETLAACV